MVFFSLPHVAFSVLPIVNITTMSCTCTCLCCFFLQTVRLEVIFLLRVLFSKTSRVWPMLCFGCAVAAELICVCS